MAKKLRWRYLVSRLQLRLAIGSLMYLLPIVVLFFGLLFLPAVVQLFDESATPFEREQAAREVLALNSRLGFAVPVVVALCVLHAIVVSHRTAGPLHRFKKIFADLGDGDLTMRVDVRRHDYLRHEADVITDMIRATGARVGSIRRSYHEAGATLPELMEALNRGDTHEAAVAAGKLGTQMDRLGDCIREFRIPLVDDPEHSPNDARQRRPEPSRTVG